MVFGRQNFSENGRRNFSSEVDEMSVLFGRRNFSGRRNFCPLVDEISVLLVYEISVPLGRRNFSDP